MGLIKRYTPAIISVLLMYVVLCIIYPHYEYYIDPDGTAYLTIAHRYATGDCLTAINGYWSPWSCWLTALLIKMGVADIPASVMINALGATGFLLVSQSFFLKFKIINKLQWVLCATLSLFLCYAVFWQSFDDLWECFFLLIVMRIMVQDGYKHKPALWVACGVLGALAYFAKAYSFPFFILNTIGCGYYISIENRKLWLKMSAVSIVVMALCSLPWICLLHERYGIWTTSTSGPLNMSWYLVGHPYWKPDIGVLIPPAYKGSPYYWEDPYVANGITPHFWDTSHLLGLQVLRTLFNLIKFLRSLVQLSVLFPVIGVIAVISLRAKFGIFAGKVKLLIFTSLLFPVGYVLINFEARYLWYMLPLGMTLGTLLIQSPAVGKWKRVVLVVFPLTFLFYPVWCMRTMYDAGKREYKMAQELKKNNIQGSFASYSTPGASAQATERLAYFSGCSYYINQNNANDTAFAKEVRRCHIKYYIGCTPSSMSKYILEALDDENGGNPYPEVKTGDEGLYVQLLNP